MENIKRSDPNSNEDLRTGSNRKKKKKVQPHSVEETNPCQGNAFDMKDELMQDFRNRHLIRISGLNDKEHFFRPCLEFGDSNLPKLLVEYLYATFDRPTPIQSECWPIALASRDLIGIAKTGSGKTFAFGMPALARCLGSLSWQVRDKTPTKDALAQPRVLIVVPTRELAIQIAGVLKIPKISDELTGQIRIVSVYGGVPKESQVAMFRRRGGVDILIATPGRLCDLMDEGVCDVSYVEFVVLDEADRMLDLGFDRDIRKIMNVTGISLTKESKKQRRQTLMFSATWPSEVQDLSLRYLSTPITVTLGGDVSQATANTDVKQIVEVIEPHAKGYRLESLLHEYHVSRKNRILIFVLYKKEASRLENSLMKRGWKVQAIHGDMNQFQRMQVMDRFRQGIVPLLIATDVAARGLDIPDVEYVINYTFPLTIEDYVHRIGRTARAGSKGIAHSFFTKLDKSHSGELAAVLLKAGQTVPESLSKFGLHIKRKKHHIYGDFYREVTDTTNTPSQPIHIKFED
jgi:ATP-dependent RNA helicase DBP3